MKKEPNIIIKFNITNYNDNLKNIILDKLTKLAKKHFADKVKIEFSLAKQYWKIPEHMLCYFDVYCDNKIKVKELKNIFGVDWRYTCTPTCDVDDPEEKTIMQESAI